MLNASSSSVQEFPADPSSLPLWISDLTSQPLQLNKPTPCNKSHTYPTSSFSLVKPWLEDFWIFWILTHIFTISSFFRWYWSHPNRTQTFGKGNAFWDLLGDIVVVGGGWQDTLNKYILACLHLKVWILSSISYQGISGISTLFSEDHRWESIALFISTARIRTISILSNQRLNSIFLEHIPSSRHGKFNWHCVSAIFMVKLEVWSLALIVLWLWEIKGYFSKIIDIS